MVILSDFPLISTVDGRNPAPVDMVNLKDFPMEPMFSFLSYPKIKKAKEKQADK